MRNWKNCRQTGMVARACCWFLLFFLFLGLDTCSRQHPATDAKIKTLQLLCELGRFREARIKLSELEALGGEDFVAFDAPKRTICLSERIRVYAGIGESQDFDRLLHDFEMLAGVGKVNTHDICRDVLKVLQAECCWEEYVELRSRIPDWGLPKTSLKTLENETEPVVQLARLIFEAETKSIGSSVAPLETIGSGSEPWLIGSPGTVRLTKSGAEILATCRTDKDSTGGYIAYPLPLTWREGFLAQWIILPAELEYSSRVKVYVGPWQNEVLIRDNDRRTTDDSTSYFGLRFTCAGGGGGGVAALNHDVNVEAPLCLIVQTKRPPFQRNTKHLIRFGLIPGPQGEGLWWLDIRDLKTGKTVVHRENTAPMPDWNAPVILAGLPSRLSANWWDGGIRANVFEMLVFQEAPGAVEDVFAQNRNGSFRKKLNEAHRFFVARRFEQAAQSFEDLLEEEGEDPVSYAERTWRCLGQSLLFTNRYENVAIGHCLRDDDHTDPVPYRILVDSYVLHSESCSKTLAARLRAIVHRRVARTAYEIKTAIWAPVLRNCLNEVSDRFGLEPDTYPPRWPQLWRWSKPVSKHVVDSTLVDLDYYVTRAPPAGQPLLWWMRCDCALAQCCSLTEGDLENLLAGAEECMAVYYEALGLGHEVLRQEDFHWEEYVHSLKHFSQQVLSLVADLRKFPTADKESQHGGENVDVLLNNALALAQTAVDKSHGSDPEAFEILARVYALIGNIKMAESSAKRILDCPAFAGGPKIGDLPVLARHFEKKFTDLIKQSSSGNNLPDTSAEK